MDQIKVKNILIAVSNKETIDKLLPLIKSDKIWATEGTAKYIKLKVETVNPVALGFDFDGRVKTIDRNTFIRILADRSKKRHILELSKLASQGEALQGWKAGMEPFDLIIVDLYPLDKKNFPEFMDIGGQALIRAAIKNYKYVALAFDAESIKDLAEELRLKRGETSLAFRKAQAKAAIEFIAERCKVEAGLLGLLR